MEPMDLIKLGTIDSKNQQIKKLGLTMKLESTPCFFKIVIKV
jgi:hypothetical protein